MAAKEIMEGLLDSSDALTKKTAEKLCRCAEDRAPEDRGHGLAVHFRARERISTSDPERIRQKEESPEAIPGIFVRALAWRSAVERPREARWRFGGTSNSRRQRDDLQHHERAGHPR